MHLSIKSANDGSVWKAGVVSAFPKLPVESLVHEDVHSLFVF